MCSKSPHLPQFQQSAKATPLWSLCPTLRKLKIFLMIYTAESILPFRNIFPFLFMAQGQIVNLPKPHCSRKCPDKVGLTALYILANNRSIRSWQAPFLCPTGDLAALQGQKAEKNHCFHPGALWIFSCATNCSRKCCFPHLRYHPPNPVLKLDLVSTCCAWFGVWQARHASDALTFLLNLVRNSTLPPTCSWMQGNLAQFCKNYQHLRIHAILYSVFYYLTLFSLLIVLYLKDLKTVVNCLNVHLFMMETVSVTVNSK